MSEKELSHPGKARAKPEVINKALNSLCFAEVSAQNTEPILQD